MINIKELAMLLSEDIRDNNGFVLNEAGIQPGQPGQPGGKPQTGSGDEITQNDDVVFQAIARSIAIALDEQDLYRMLDGGKVVTLQQLETDDVVFVLNNVSVKQLSGNEETRELQVSGVMDEAVIAANTDQERTVLNVPFNGKLLITPGGVEGAIKIYGSRGKPDSGSNLIALG
jgi:hypothetical protein